MSWSYYEWTIAWGDIAEEGGRREEAVVGLGVMALPRLTAWCESERLVRDLAWMGVVDWTDPRGN